MKRSVVITLGTSLRRKAGAGRARLRQPAPSSPVVPALPPCETMIFLEWLTTSNMGGDQPRLLP